MKKNQITFLTIRYEILSEMTCTEELQHENLTLPGMPVSDLQCNSETNSSKYLFWKFGLGILQSMCWSYTPHSQALQIPTHPQEAWACRKDCEYHS